MSGVGVGAGYRCSAQGQSQGGAEKESYHEDDPERSSGGQAQYKRGQVSIKLPLQEPRGSKRPPWRVWLLTAIGLVVMVLVTVAIVLFTTGVIAKGECIYAGALNII